MNNYDSIGKHVYSLISKIIADLVYVVSLLAELRLSYVCKTKR